MDYDIFREELAIKYPIYGHALWEPSPGARYTAVQVGDVGFIREGYFHRLFNVLLPADHESHRGGVPQNHEPLTLRMSPAPTTDSGTLPPNHLRSKGVSDLSDVDGIHALGPDPAPLSFSCCGRQGAILSLPLSAQREDTAARGDFARCIIKHIDEWFVFARERGLGISRREDIVLVTGRHLARSWANIAFHERDERVSFRVQVKHNSGVEWQFTPEGAGGVALNLGPSGENLPEDQCIFIRGFRVTRFSSRLIPWLRGAAEPTQIHDDDNDLERDIQLASTSEDIHHQDPLHVLLEYITEQAPDDCDMALVHDDDLLCIENASLESLKPNTVMSYLRKSMPKVWQLQCGLPPSSHVDEGDTTTERPPQVATISKYTVDLVSNSLILDAIAPLEMNEPRPTASISSARSPPSFTLPMSSDQRELHKLPTTEGGKPDHQGFHTQPVVPCDTQSGSSSTLPQFKGTSDTVDTPPLLPRILSEKLRQQIFVHRSPGVVYSYSLDAPDSDAEADNEELVCIGDQVLTLALMDLINDLYPKLRVGPASKLKDHVKRECVLAEICVSYRLHESLKINFRDNQARDPTDLQSVRVDVFKAYVGGVYRDQGLEAVSKWLNPLFQARVEAAYGDLDILHLLPSVSGTSAFLPTVDPSTRYLSPDLTPLMRLSSPSPRPPLSPDFRSFISDNPYIVDFSSPPEDPASAVSSHLVENPVASRPEGLARHKRKRKRQRPPSPRGG